MTRRAILSGWPAGRVYYEVRPRTPGPAYRVTVQDVISNFNGAP
jgi:hypothetical protein